MSNYATDFEMLSLVESLRDNERAFAVSRPIDVEITFRTDAPAVPAAEGQACPCESGLAFTECHGWSQEEP